MAYRRTEFAPGEWYHCYSRGIDKRRVFETEPDYERFLQALYLCNDKGSFDRGTFQHLPHAQIMRRPRKEPLVAIGAFCLMPSHFHLLIRENDDGGISKFMQKAGTSYTMYFNTKRERTGGLFTKPFRSKHIANDRYLKRVTQYIHLNPAELIEHGWKQGAVGNLSGVLQFLKSYRFSSLPDYLGSDRIEGTILDADSVDMLRHDAPSLKNLVDDAAAYYASLPS